MPASPLQLHLEHADDTALTHAAKALTAQLHKAGNSSIVVAPQDIINAAATAGAFLVATAAGEFVDVSDMLGEGCIEQAMANGIAWSKERAVNHKLLERADVLGFAQHLMDHMGARVVAIEFTGALAEEKQRAMEQ